jgi:phosphocarrier protein
MINKKVVVKNLAGLHARPALELYIFCQKIDNDIKILAGNIEIEPKSVISILSAGVKCGTEIMVQVEGPDEEKNCDYIVAFIENLKD